MFHSTRSKSINSFIPILNRTRLWIALWFFLFTISILRLPLWSRSVTSDLSHSSLSLFSQSYSADVEEAARMDLIDPNPMKGDKTNMVVTDANLNSATSVSYKSNLNTLRIRESNTSSLSLSSSQRVRSSAIVSSSIQLDKSNFTTPQTVKHIDTLQRKRSLRTVEEMIRDIHPLFPYKSSRKFSVLLMTSWFGGDMPFFTGSYTCPASLCSISMSRVGNDMLDSQSADLLLYHVAPPDYSNKNGEGIVSPSNDKQLLGLMAAEGFDLVEGRSNDFYKRFNTEMTFRPCSLVRDSYVHWFLNDWFKQGISSQQKVFNFSTARVWSDIWEPPLPIEQRSKKHLASWSSHYCRGARSKREDLVRALLAAGLRISIYGDTSNCLRNADEEELKKDRFGQFVTMRSHKFYLAFENHRLEGYVTEKFYWALLRGQVPVVWGAPDIERYAPGKDSYIDASKFSNATALTEYLNALDEDDEAYMEFHKWRTETSFEDYGDVLREEITELIWIGSYSMEPAAWYNCRTCHAFQRYYRGQESDKSSERLAPKLGIKTMLESEAAAYTGTSFSL